MLTYMPPVVWSMISKFIFHRCHFLPCGKWENLSFWRQRVENVGTDFLWTARNVDRFSHRRCLPGLKDVVSLLKLNDLVALKLSLEYMRLDLSIFILQQSTLVWVGKWMSRCGGTGEVSVCVWASLNSYKHKYIIWLARATDRSCASGLELFEIKNSKEYLLKYLSYKDMILLLLLRKSIVSFQSCIGVPRVHTVLLDKAGWAFPTK